MSQKKTTKGNLKTGDFLCKNKYLAALLEVKTCHWDNIQTIKVFKSCQLLQCIAKK